MEGRFLVNSNESSIESNIYANKSTLVLNWLLIKGITRKEFSLRGVSEEIGVSLGLVQRVFKTLILQGTLQAQGVRTAKKFYLKNPKCLLENWLNHYNITKKCKMRTYRSAFQGKLQLLSALKKSKLSAKVVLALHCAAEVLGCKHTNLDTLELYVLDPSIRLQLEEILQLEPKERGYEVLFVEPYYKSLLNEGVSSDKGVKVSPALLTFLDLYHFPLRGYEQAEFMLKHVPELKQICKSR